MNMNTKKPIGVLILGFLFIFVAVFGYILTFKTLSSANQKPFQVYVIIFDAIFLIGGIGLIQLRRWSRNLALILVSLKTIQLFIGGIIDTLTLINISSKTALISVAIIMTMLIVGIWGGIVKYLTREDIVKLFRS